MKKQQKQDSHVRTFNADDEFLSGIAIMDQGME